VLSNENCRERTRKDKRFYIPNVDLIGKNKNTQTYKKPQKTTEFTPVYGTESSSDLDYRNTTTPRQVATIPKDLYAVLNSGK